MNGQELKRLQTNLQKAKKEYDETNKQYNEAHRNVTKARQEMQNIETVLKSLEENDFDPVVSEHAMLRYLQRVDGLDLEELRKVVMDDKTAELIRTYKSGKFPVSDTHRVVVKNGVVVTVEA